MTSPEQDQGMARTKKSKDDGGKKNTSLRLSGKTLKVLKIHAIEEETSVQKIIEKLIEDYLDRPRKPKA